MLLLAGLSACASPPLPPEALPPRHVELDGTLNTRDLGGYETVDGRTVRWGQLFRSDQLSDLDRDDRAKLRARGLRQVIDFRIETERDGEEDRLPDGVAYVSLPMLYPEMDPEKVADRILAGDAEEGYFHDLLERANRSFALDHRAQLRQLLIGLAEPDGLPALFHCTYGKDRTGYAAALVLQLLGVPHETVVEDYLLTNAYLAPKIDGNSRWIWLGSLFRISRSNARDLLAAKEEYLETATRAVRERYGPLEVYVREGLGVPQETIDALRERLLE